MPSFRYKRDGLPLSLIKLHDTVLKNTVAYFERGKEVRKGVREARKAVKKAIKVAKKKHINPGLKIGMAREALSRVLEELEYTRQSISTTYSNLYSALDRIQQERLQTPLSLIEKAHGLFREKQVEKGLAMLKEAQAALDQKVLIKTRTALFGGTSNQVTELKDEIEAFREKRRLSQKKKGS